MFLTGRFPLLVAFGAVPVVVLDAAGFNAWYVLVGWLLLVALIGTFDVLAAPAPASLRFSRDVPQRVRLGDEVVTRLQMINEGDRTVRARIRDAWQPTAGADRGRPRVTIPPRESRTVRLGLRPRRRGELRSEFVAVRTLGPLGFAGRSRAIEAAAATRVLPPFHARRHLASRVQRLRELDGATSLQVRGQGTEFDSLREYVRGDDVRSIDWRATARASTTMLRTWRPERDRHVTIILDTGRTAAARVGDETRLDATFEAALLLAALAARAGDNVHVVAFDRVVRARVTGVSGTRLLPTMVDALAPVEAQMIDTDWDGALAEARKLARRPSLVVILTAQEALSSSRDFLARLATIPDAATTVLVGTVTDAGLADAARAGGSVTNYYRAAAAEATRHDADLVAQAIARAGAEALADTPEGLPPRIADRYLALKKAGRL